MSTNGNLPAGQFTTRINGKQCTAIPRSDIQRSSAAATSAPPPPPPPVVVATSPVAAPETTSPSPQVETQPVVDEPEPIVEPPTTFSTSTTPEAAPIPSTPQAISTPPVATSIVLPLPVETLTSESPQSSTEALLATPVSSESTPTTSSQTTLPIALGELHTSTTPSISISTRTSDISSQQILISSTPTATAPNQAESSSDSEANSTSKVNVGPIIGGILGGLALIAALVALLWFCRRRRRRRPDSILTPLTGRDEKTYYEIDRGSVGPTKRTEKWMAEVNYHGVRLSTVIAELKAGVAGIGTSLRSKVVGNRSDTPSVNLNRGNSQFIESVSQHSRNPSVLSSTVHLTTRDRFEDWWDRVSDRMGFNGLFGGQARDAVDPFAAARSMSEDQPKAKGDPDFSKLVGMDENDMQLQAERRRISLRNSVPTLGSLGLDFDSTDPFADPVLAAPPQSQNKAWVPPNLSAAVITTNPFADPITQPKPSILKPQTYVADIRRSRGQSVDATKTTSTYAPTTQSAYNSNTSAFRPPSTAVGSRYPSSIAPSMDSYRDTVLSTVSANGRKGKGRSDPFDLERPELWRPIIPPVMPDNGRSSVRIRGGSMATDRDSLYPGPLHPNPLRMSAVEGIHAGQSNHSRATSATTPRVASSAYESKYSSGVSSLGDWGDPGPDLGPNSSTSSLRGNASSNSSEVYKFSDADAKGIYGEGVIKGSLAEIPSTSNSNEWDERRSTYNVSPLSVESKTSSKGGVGKAM